MIWFFYSLFKYTHVPFFWRINAYFQVKKSLHLQKALTLKTHVCTRIYKFIVLLYSCSFVLLYFCTFVLLYYCTFVLKYFCNCVILYSCILNCNLLLLYSCTLDLVAPIFNFTGMTL